MKISDNPVLIRVWQGVLDSLDCRPCLVERAMIVKSSSYSYRVAPYLDRTALMKEVMERLEKTQ